LNVHRWWSTLSDADKTAYNEVMQKVPGVTRETLWRDESK